MPEPLSISDVAASARHLPPSGRTHIIEKVRCELLPNREHTDWGRDCIVKKLNVQEQIRLLGAISDGVKSDAKLRKMGDKDVSQSDEASQQWWESVWLLVLGCVDPVFSPTEAIEWLSTDERDGIACADVGQFLLFQIRSINDEVEGMEDIAAAMRLTQKAPLAMHALEQAYLKGGSALDLLLEGRAPDTQDEMAEYIERWGAIIATVAFSVLRKQAKILGEEASVAILDKLIEFGLNVGVLEGKESKSADEDDEE